jgi:probable phosphoglycerate mutase
MRARAAGESLAGPIVATIFVRRVIPAYLADVELLLVRHALPERVEVETGAADPGLTEVGILQAERLADYLHTERIDAVYSSPLRRAVETVAPLAERRGLTVATVAEVAEWDRDASVYVPVEELRARGDSRFEEITRHAWTDMALIVPFRDRVVAAIDAVIEAHPGGRVVVGCHAGVVNVYLGEVLGLPVDRRGFHYPNYTSIARVAASRSGARTVVTVNETAHLRDTGLLHGLIQRS